MQNRQVIKTPQYLTKICEIIICFVVVGELEAEFVALTRAERPLPYYGFGVQVINLRLQYLNSKIKIFLMTRKHTTFSPSLRLRATEMGSTVL